MEPVDYSVPDKYTSQFTRIYKQREKAGILVAVSTANAPPMVVLGKNDGQAVRIVVNLKEQNSNTEKAVSPLPCLECTNSPRRWQIRGSELGLMSQPRSSNVE